MAAKKKPQADPEASACARDLRPTVAERVAVIRRRMVSRTWAYDQAALLAEEWGVSLVLVQAHAAEASRQIEAMLDPAQVRAALDGLLLEAADAARQEERPAERARALCQVVREGRELAGIGVHRDPKNDPKPTGQQAPAEVPFWLKNKEQPS